jgi:phosphatidate cytidylyltransferase
MGLPANLPTRSLSALAYVVILLGTLLAGPWSFFAFLLFVSLGAVYELIAMAERKGVHPPRMFLYCINALVLSVNFFSANGTISYTWLVIIIPLIFSLFLLELFKSGPKPFEGLPISFLVVLYCVLPFALAAHLVFVNHNYHFEFLLGSIFMIWANDTFAYFAGSMFGKHKIMEKVSPKKTYEGLVGGVIGVSVLAYFMGDLLWWGSKTDWLIIGLIVSVMGSLGDFIESLFKRDANVKDSGKIMPGHGGFLDRLDSLIFALPFIFTYLFIANKIY